MNENLASKAESDAGDFFCKPWRERCARVGTGPLESSTAVSRLNKSSNDKLTTLLR